MKKIFILTLIVSVLFSKEIKAQTGVPDTLVYLKNIVANKTQYIGKPFSVLLADLQIQIKHFMPNTDIIHDISKETSTSFGFYFPQNSDEMYLAYPRLRITWQTPLDITLSDIIRNNNRGSWNQSSNLLYSNSIIADIKIRE